MDRLWCRDGSQHYRQVVVVASDTATKLVLEPWGHELELARGVTVYVVVRSARPSAVEIVWRDDALEVWAWTGSVLDMFGEEGGHILELHITVPEMPRGVGTLPLAVENSV